MNLRDKPPAEIIKLLEKTPRVELLALIVRLIAVEPLFTPAQIATLSQVRRRDVLLDINAGKFGDYYARSPNSLRVPGSGINAWRERWRVRVTQP